MEGKIICIRTNGTHEVITWNANDSLRQLQKLVGGHIEIVRCNQRRRQWAVVLGDDASRRLVCVVNEEGVIMGLRANGVATWAASYPGMLFGDAVFMLEEFNEDGEPDLVPFSEAEATPLSLLLDLSGCRSARWHDDGSI